MSVPERARSESHRDSRSPDRDHRNSCDRRDSRYRERSPDENTKLRLEMKAMMARLRALENKSSASSLLMRSSDRDVLAPENTCRNMWSTRRQQTSPSSRRHSLILPDRAKSSCTRRLASPSRHIVAQSRDRFVSSTRDRRKYPRSLSSSPPRDSEVLYSRKSNAPRTPEQSTVTDRIVDAIRSINNVGRSNQHIYISQFDPNLHNIDDWCAEVDRAKSLNNWNDYECLSRIGNCLKGEAQSWLNEWVSSDRSWSNFKKEFRPLCPKTPDVASILADVINTNSDEYPTYADYARRSLLRLRILRGLSDELISAIIIRGITDSSIRASATNAKLLPNDLIDFFCIYVKPSSTAKNFSSRSVPLNSAKDKHTAEYSRKRGGDLKCFSCGQLGNREISSTKRPKTNTGSCSSSLTSNSTISKLDFIPTRSKQKH